LSSPSEVISCSSVSSEPRDSVSAPSELGFPVSASISASSASFNDWAIVGELQRSTGECVGFTLTALLLRPSLELLTETAGLVAEWEAKISIFKYVTPDPWPYSLPYTWKFLVYDSFEAFIKYKEHVLAVNSTQLKPTWGVLGLDTAIVKLFTTGLECKDFVFHEIKKIETLGQ
ncbi:hypothetical protein CMV_027495, partial [Castanea mollissima]